MGEGRGPIPEEEQYLVVGEGRGPMPEEEQYLLVGGRVPIPEISPPLFMQTDVLLPTSHLNNIVSMAVYICKSKFVDFENETT